MPTGCRAAYLGIKVKPNQWVGKVIRRNREYVGREEVGARSGQRLRTRSYYAQPNSCHQDAPRTPGHPVCSPCSLIFLRKVFRLTPSALAVRVCT